LARPLADGAAGGPLDRLRVAGDTTTNRGDRDMPDSSTLRIEADAQRPSLARLLLDRPDRPNAINDATPREIRVAIGRPRWRGAPSTAGRLSSPVERKRMPPNPSPSSLPVSS